MKHGILLSINGAGRGTLMINGAPVMAEKITIEVDAGKKTKVTLTLPPEGVLFRSDDIDLDVIGFKRIESRTGPPIDGEDVALWPDGFHCFVNELSDFSDKSDDYEIVPFGTDRHKQLTES